MSSGSSGSGCRCRVGGKMHTASKLAAIWRHWCVQVSEVNPRANFRYHIDVERPPDMRSYASQRVNCTVKFCYFSELVALSVCVNDLNSTSTCTKMSWTSNAYICVWLLNVFWRNVIVIWL